VKRMLATLGIWAALAAQTLAHRTMTPKDIHHLALRPGDRVTISGSVSAAATVASIHELNGIAATLNYPDAITKEQDTVYLIANSCRVTKENSWKETRP
jgi:hypothetical protein